MKPIAIATLLISFLLLFVAGAESEISLNQIPEGSKLTIQKPIPVPAGASDVYFSNRQVYTSEQVPPIGNAIHNGMMCAIHLKQDFHASTIQPQTLSIHRSIRDVLSGEYVFNFKNSDIASIRCSHLEIGEAYRENISGTGGPNRWSYRFLYKPQRLTDFYQAVGDSIRIEFAQTTLLSKR